MIARSLHRLPLRLKQDPTCLHSLPQTITTTIRLASTAPPAPIPDAKPLRKRSVRIVTPAERAYAARKHLRKKPRPIQIDSYTQKLIDARTSAIKARQRGGASRIDETVEEGDNAIHGKGGKEGETPFVKSLALGMDADQVYIPDEDGVPSRAPGIVNTGLKEQDTILASENTGVARPEHLAHFVSQSELERFGELSNALAAPVKIANRAIADPEREAQRQVRHEEEHATRMAALARILAVENQGSSQRHKINTRRIVDEFGRHETDHTIDPRQRIRQPWHEPDWAPKERIGPDTGSSEVQIGLLTAKIKLLAKEFEGRSKNDKMNKRNLRLLLHRRQKLLAYFYKRDKAGERWQHMVEKLGITPAMWKGEIEVR